MMVDQKAARLWMRENYPERSIGVKGRLPEDLMRIYTGEAVDVIPEEIAEGQFADEELAPIRPDEEVPFKPEKKHRIKDFFTPKVKVGRSKRVPVDSMVSLTYSMMGNIVKNISATSPVSPLLPVSRVMEMQAPAVGIVVDDVIKGTVFDSVLQPLAKTKNSGDALWGIIGPPVLVGVIASNPGTQQMLLPVLRESLKSYVLTAGPAMKKKAAREQKIMEELGMPADEGIDSLLATIFAPPEGYTNDFAGE